MSPSNSAMKTGPLWSDDDPRKTLEEKAQRAAAHYEHKYGHSPNIYFAHHRALDGDGKQPIKKAGGVEIRAGRSVLQSHFWLGTKPKTRAQQRR